MTSARGTDPSSLSRSGWFDCRPDAQPCNPRILPTCRRAAGATDSEGMRPGGIGSDPYSLRARVQAVPLYEEASGRPQKRLRQIDLTVAAPGSTIPAMTTEEITTGRRMLHFNPSTGRIVRVVVVIDIRGEAVEVEHANNPSKGKRYVVSASKLAPV